MSDREIIAIVNIQGSILELGKSIGNAVNAAEMYSELFKGPMADTCTSAISDMKSALKKLQNVAEVTGGENGWIGKPFVLVPQRPY